MSHKVKNPPEWQQAVTNGSVADPGARNFTDATWVHRNLEWLAAQPVPNYAQGSGEGHNNGS